MILCDYDTDFSVFSKPECFRYVWSELPKMLVKIEMKQSPNTWTLKYFLT